MHCMRIDSRIIWYSRGGSGGYRGRLTILDKPRPQRRTQQAEYYSMDAGAEGWDGGRGLAQPTSDNGIKPGSIHKPNKKGADGPSRSDAKPNAQTNGGGALGRASDQTQAAASSSARNMGNGGSATAPPGGTAGAGNVDAPVGDAGTAATTIRFGGAASEEQERGMLREAAEQALELARVKFLGAEKGQDTDNAALLYAHQQVLTRIGVPSNLAERQAYERWRVELAASLERVAAERFSDGGAYW